MECIESSDQVAKQLKKTYGFDLCIIAFGYLLHVVFVSGDRRPTYVPIIDRTSYRLFSISFWFQRCDVCEGTGK